MIDQIMLPKMLEEHIQEWSNRDFIWGKWDCANFCNSWFLKLTGYDYKLPSYENSKEALEVLTQKGGYVVSLKTRGLKEIERTRCEAGDLAYMVRKNFSSIGIVCGSKCAFIGEKNVHFISTDRMFSFWSIRNNA